MMKWGSGVDMLLAGRVGTRAWRQDAMGCMGVWELETGKRERG